MPEPINFGKKGLSLSPFTLKQKTHYHFGKAHTCVMTIAYTGVVARCLNFTVYAILMQLFCVAGLKLGRDAMLFIRPNCPQFKYFLAGNSQCTTTPV